MRIASVALSGVACGPSAVADAGSSTGASATDGAADTTGVTVITATTGDSSTGDAPTLCLSTVTIVLDTTDAFVHFADVDGDDRPELWRHENLGRPGEDVNVMRLDAFLVEADGSATAVGTNEIEGSFQRYADVDGDGGDDLLMAPQLDAGGERVWHPGQADLTFASPQPISLADDDFQSWMDVDGDGDDDVFGSGTVSGLVTLYLGDGTGEFTSAGTLQFPIGEWISTVVPTPEPGVFIAADYNGADLFGAAFSFWRIEVGARGVPTAVAGTAELPHVFLLAANDFDGDAVTDLLTMHEIESEDELHLWTVAGDGYVERTVAIDVDEAAVGDFLADGGVQLLYTDSAGHLWLLPTPLADGAAPVAVEGMLTGIDRVLDLGSDSQDEVVSRALDGVDDHAYAMHDVEPCG